MATGKLATAVRKGTPNGRHIEAGKSARSVSDGVDLTDHFTHVQLTRYMQHKAAVTGSVS